MSSRKNKDFYTEEELQKIKEQWFADKKRIDADPAYEYYVDRYREYEKYFANKNLRSLFHFASFLYRYITENEFLYLFPGEKEKILEAFRRLIDYGYYDQSKEKEKRVRTHLGKIVRRQSYEKYKKRN